MSKRNLWSRINGYNFEHVVQPELRDRISGMFGGPDATTQAFASKLATKMGWSRDFALRAIAEYKRFVYLGTVGSAHVTPSRVIDQVWHQHILFSRAYREFCQDIIGRQFDHNPELVPLPGQHDVFGQQYLDTLDAYRTEFNEIPPADIWAVPKFSAADVRRAPRRLDRAHVDRWGDNTPLYMYYERGERADGFWATGTDAGSSDSVSFGGGGDFAGGGSSRDWSGSSGDDSAADSGVATREATAARAARPVAAAAAVVAESRARLFKSRCGDTKDSLSEP